MDLIVRHRSGGTVAFHFWYFVLSWEKDYTELKTMLFLLPRTYFSKTNIHDELGGSCCSIQTTIKSHQHKRSSLFFFFFPSTRLEMQCRASSPHIWIISKKRQMEHYSCSHSIQELVSSRNPCANVQMFVFLFIFMEI